MITKESIVKISDDVVKREIQGSIVIVPVTSGIGDSDDKMFSLNDVGKDIVSKIDSVSTVDEISSALSKEYNTQKDIILNDVISFLDELLQNGIISTVE